LSESPDGTTWDFDPEGREAFQVTMRWIGYGETDSAKTLLDTLLVNKIPVGGYWCYNCISFKEDDTSPTGYRCTKYGVPDKAHGCCKGHEEKKQ